MDSKPLLIGIVSFIAGALLVSTAATTFDKPGPSPDSMSSMIQSLKGKSGYEFDEEFISQMVVHHEGAVEMAKLTEQRAKHSEIKKLSEDIISAQEREINQMKEWQKLWGYEETLTPIHDTHQSGN